MAAGDAERIALGGALEAVKQLSERITEYRDDGRRDRREMREELVQRIDAVGAGVERIAAEQHAQSQRLARLERPSVPPPPDIRASQAELEVSVAKAQADASAARWRTYERLAPPVAALLALVVSAAAAAQSCTARAHGVPPAASAGRP